MAGALMWIALSYVAGALATYSIVGGALATGLRAPQRGLSDEGHAVAEEIAAALPDAPRAEREAV